MTSLDYALLSWVSVAMQWATHHTLGTNGFSKERWVFVWMLMAFQGFCIWRVFS